jgi:hypothetical protein
VQRGVAALAQDPPGDLEQGGLITGDKDRGPLGVVARGGVRGADDDVVKHDHKLVGVDLAKAKASIESTISYLKTEHGPEEWAKGMHPEIPESETLNNPYTYRDDVSAWKESE